jgi:hypothetical protein
MRTNTFRIYDLRFTSAVRINCWLLGLLLAMALMTGCGEAESPAKPITLEEIPAALSKAFASSKAETKDISGQTAAAVQAKDYAKAATLLENLRQRPNLTSLQGRTIAGAAMSVHAALVEAEAQGDKQAAEVLNLQRMTK